MDSFIESVFEFISNLVASALVGGGLLLFAGEIRLAALKKASLGSSKLSSFTSKMTKSELPLSHGGHRRAGKKSH